MLVTMLVMMMVRIESRTNKNDEKNVSSQNAHCDDSDENGA